MSNTLRITTLAENTAGGHGTLGEHGLAFWVEAGPHRLLFDTGQGMVLLPNADRLGVELDQADAIVLSHGHYDHTGGLASALEAIGPTKVYAHPAAFQAKYARNDDGTSRYIGVSGPNEESTREKAGGLVWTEKPTEIVEDVFVTGEIARVSGFEDVGGPFFLDNECTRQDSLLDDQALFFPSAQRVVVLLGCAHAGVVNTLQYIHRITGGKPIHAVIGGMHLLTASQQRIRRTIDALHRLGVEFLAPMHCTGMTATVELWKAFPEKCIRCPVGTTMTFEAPEGWKQHA